MCSSTLHRTHMSDMGWLFAVSVLSPFLNMGDTFASFQILDNFPWSMDHWKMTWRMRASSLWRVCSTIGLS